MLPPTHGSAFGEHIPIPTVKGWSIDSAESVYKATIEKGIINYKVDAGLGGLYWGGA